MEFSLHVFSSICSGHESHYSFSHKLIIGIKRRWIIVTAKSKKIWIVMANEEILVPPIGVAPPSVPVLSQNYRLVSLSEYEGPPYFRRSSKNKVLRGLLLHVHVGYKGAKKTPFMANHHIIIPSVCLVAWNRQ